MTTLYIDQEEIEVDEKLYFVDFKIEASMVYEPARVGGTADTDRPDESSCDIESITILHVEDEEGEEIRVTPKLATAFKAALDQASMEEALWEIYHDEEGEDDFPEED